MGVTTYLRIRSEGTFRQGLSSPAGQRESISTADSLLLTKVTISPVTWALAVGARAK